MTQLLFISILINFTKKTKPMQEKVEFFVLEYREGISIHSRGFWKEPGKK